MRAPSSLLLHVVLAILVILWGTTWAAIRIGLESVPPFTGAALRFLLAGIVLLGIAAARRIPFGRKPLEIRVWITNGLLLFVGSFGTVYWAEQWVPSGIAAVLFATFPLLVTVLAHFLVPGERMNARVLGGVLLGFAGVAVLYSEDFGRLGDERAAFAAVVFLISPISCAFANVLVKRWGKGIHPVSLTTIPMLIGVVGLGAGAWGFERDLPVRFDAVSVGVIVYLAILGSVATFLLYFWALEHLPVTKISLIAYLTPIMAVAIGSLFLGEPLTARVVVGGAGILAGVILAGRRPSSPKTGPT